MFGFVEARGADFALRILGFVRLAETLSSRSPGLGFRVFCLGFRGLGFRVSGLGFRV